MNQVENRRKKEFYDFIVPILLSILGLVGTWGLYTLMNEMDSMKEGIVELRTSQATIIATLAAQHEKDENVALQLENLRKQDQWLLERIDKKKK